MPRGGKRPGAGRPKNAPNKATRDIKATAACYTVEAVHELAKMAGLTPGNPGAESEQARISAIKELLDRGHGRPQYSVDLSFSERSLQHLTDQELEEIITAGGQLMPVADDGFEKQSEKINGRAVDTGELQRGRQCQLSAGRIDERHR